MRQDNVTKLLTDIQVMKGKQESMDSKLIAMKQYVCGEGWRKSHRLLRAFLPPHVGFGAGSGAVLRGPHEHHHSPLVTSCLQPDRNPQHGVKVPGVQLCFETLPVVVRPSVPLIWSDVLGDVLPLWVSLVDIFFCLPLTKCNCSVLCCAGVLGSFQIMSAALLLCYCSPPPGPCPLAPVGFWLCVAH